MSTPDPSRPAAARRRPLLALLTVLTLALAAPATARAEVISPTWGTPPAEAPTVVSLTFDDGIGSQLQGAQILDAEGIDATFFITTSWTGQPGFLARTDLTDLAGRGHEIGGHTVTHRDLAQLPEAEVRRQICNGRATLEDWGFAPTSFAYPFASSTTVAQAATDDCGYDTARGLGDIRSPESCAGCPVAETLPPADTTYLAAPDQVAGSWTLEHLKQQVTQAREGGGGWVVLTFHDVCDDIGAAGCPASQSVQPSTLTAFAAWLSDYVADPTNLTSTATVGETYRGSMGSSYPGYRAPVREPSTPPSPIDTNGVQNPSLEDVGSVPGVPSCWERGGWGTRNVTWGTAPGRTGSVAQRLTMSSRTSGDAKLLPEMDLGSCAPTAKPFHTYEIGTWYTSDAITQFALYYRTTGGEWRYWTSSPWFAPASAWTEATWRTPPLPYDGTAVSFGLALIEDGTLTTDDYRMVDTGTAPL